MRPLSPLYSHICVSRCGTLKLPDSPGQGMRLQGKAAGTLHEGCTSCKREVCSQCTRVGRYGGLHRAVRAVGGPFRLVAYCATPLRCCRCLLSGNPTTLWCAQHSAVRSWLAPTKGGTLLLRQCIEYHTGTKTAEACYSMF
jgi:hypothetical protein